MFTLEFFLCQTKFIQNSFYSLEDWASRPRLPPAYDKTKCAHGYNRMGYSICVKCFCASSGRVLRLQRQGQGFDSQGVVLSKATCSAFKVRMH